MHFSHTRLLILLAAIMLLTLAACGGGETPLVPPPGDGGNNGGGNGGGNNGGLVIPPVETFQDMSPDTDDNTTSWLKDAFLTLPATGTAAAPYQNASLEAYADQVFAAVNAERATEGLPALARSTDLDNLAQAHARDMALRDYFSHDTEGYGIDYVGRLDAVDPAPYNFMGENIAGNQLTPEVVMQTWMGSPPHRANILHENYGHVGIGCYYNAGPGPYRIYWVQVFARFNGDPDAHTWIQP